MAAFDAFRNFAPQLATTGDAALQETDSYAATVASCHAAIKNEPKSIELPKPPKPVERMPVFLRGPSKWREPDGEVITAGPHCTVSPPAAIARAALEFGHTVSPDAKRPDLCVRRWIRITGGGFPIAASI